MSVPYWPNGHPWAKGQSQGKRAHLLEINSSPQRAGPTRLEQAWGSETWLFSFSCYLPFLSSWSGAKATPARGPALKKSLQFGNNENIIPKCLLPLPASTVSHDCFLRFIFSSLPGELLVILQSPAQKSLAWKLLFRPPPEPPPGSSLSPKRKKVPHFVLLAAVA